MIAGDDGLVPGRIAIVDAGGDAGDEGVVVCVEEESDASAGVGRGDYAVEAGFGDVLDICAGKGGEGVGWVSVGEETDVDK